MGHVKVDVFLKRNNTDTGWTFYCGYWDFWDNDRIHPLTYVSQAAWEEKLEIESMMLASIPTDSRSSDRAIEIIKSSDKSMRRERGTVLTERARQEWRERYKRWGHYEKPETETEREERERKESWAAWERWAIRKGKIEKAYFIEEKS